MEIKPRPNDWVRIWPLASGQDDNVWRFTEEERSLFEGLVSDADPENVKIFILDLEQTCSSYKVFYDIDLKIGDREVLKFTNTLKKAIEALNG